MTVVMVEDLDPASADAGVPAHYGDPMREQRTLATAVGLVDRSNRDVVAVPGEERASWLHTLTTQHLSDLSQGQGTELLVLSPHGHVEQHALVTEDGETTWLDTEPGAGAGLLKYLEMMRFFTKVEPREATGELAVLSLVGPGAADLFPELAEPRLQAVPGAKFAAGDLAAEPTSLYAVSEYAGGLVRRVPLGVDLLVPRVARLGVIEKLGVPLAGLWAYEAIRVEKRVPRLGWETDHRTIPAEAGFIESAVHLDKGCYRGQETVARVHNLGRPPRRLALLHFDGVATDQPPAKGTPVTRDGREIGFVGTAVRHHELGLIALAVLKRNVADGDELMVGESVVAVDPH